jgi:triosephosphate isomerase
MGKLIVGNLKMNLISLLERDGYLKSFKKEIIGKKIKNIQIILCPPMIHLESFCKSFGKKVSIGSQNIFWERSGSFTGEISPSMVKNMGAEYTIVGHSERKRYFRENDSEISLKVLSALKIGLKPILCIGENKSCREGGASVLVGQLENCLEKISGAKIENIIICYEPVWAISSNNPDHLPTADEIMSAKLIIKKFLVKKYGNKNAQKVKIIYGGSVSSLSAKEVCLDPGMDGVLVGRESLVPYEFLKIAEIING